MKYTRLMTHSEVKRRFNRTITQLQEDSKFGTMKGDVWKDTDQGLLCSLNSTGDYRGGATYASIKINGRQRHYNREVVQIMDTSTVPMDTKLFSESVLSLFVDCMTSSNIARQLVSHWDTTVDIASIGAIDMDDKGVFTCRKAGKECLLVDGKWDSKSRTIIKLGKVISKLTTTLGISRNAAEVEQLVNYIKSLSGESDSFSEVSGEAIRQYYLEDNYDYDTNVGTLGSSCMRHEKQQPYMDIYIDNSDKCSMILYSPKKNGKISARALLWKISDTEMFMDRVYGDDSTRTMFVNYAKRKGYMYKKRQSFEDKDILIVKGEVVTKEMTISLNKPLSSYDYLPYFDTFTYDAGDNKMTNVFSDRTVIGKFDNIRGSYKPIGICYVSKERTFKPLMGYREEDGTTQQAQERHLVYSNTKDCYLNMKTAIRTLSDNYVYKNNPDLVFVESQGVYELKTHTFKCAYDKKLYTRFLFAPDYGRCDMRVRTSIGYTHSINTGFVKDDGQK